MVKKPPSYYIKKTADSIYPRNKSLIETNPYLKDPIERKKLLKRFVDSSSAMEGVHCKISETILSDIAVTRLLMKKFKPGIEKKYKNEKKGA